MNRLTRTALALLQKHEWAFITGGPTTVDGRGKHAKLYINASTARSLVRRGYAEHSFTVDHNTLDITEAGVEVDV